MTAHLLEKAARAVKSARVLLDLGDTDSACSRAYYAMFDAARGALARRGYTPDSHKTHGSVHSAFAMEFVKTGLIPREIGRALGQVQDVRLLADYSAESIPSDKAEWSVRHAEAFVKAVRALPLG